MISSKAQNVATAVMCAHFLTGIYAFMVRTTSDSYAVSSNDVSWLVIDNEVWIAFYGTLLAMPVLIFYFYIQTGFMIYFLFAALFRLLCLVSIIVAHTSSTTIFKIDEFYAYSVFLGVCLEPVVFIIVLMLDRMGLQLTTSEPVYEKVE
jgi:hypothetical protein